MRAIIQGFADAGGSNLYVIASYYNGTTFLETNGSQFTLTTINTRAQLTAAAEAAVNSYASGKSYTLSEGIIWSFVQDADLPAIQAHIANAATGAATNLPTNFNLVSGVLGVANGLNDSNTAQNDLATKYNDLAAKVNTLFAHLQTQNLQSP